MPKRKPTKSSRKSAKKAKKEEKEEESKEEESKEEESKEEESLESDASIKTKIREAKQSFAEFWNDPFTFKFRPKKPHKPVKGLEFPIQMEYFPMQGLGELVRMVLEESQTPYNCSVRAGPAYDEKRKEDTPFGSAPVIRLSKDALPQTDGVLAQSSAIVRYLANKLGLDAKSAEDRAMVDMVYELALDLKTYLEHLHTENKSSWGYVKLTRLLQSAQKLLEKSGGSIFHGTKVTYADLAMFHVLTLMEASKPGCLTNEFKVAKLAQFREQMASRPTMSEYFASARRFPNTWAELHLPGHKEHGYEFIIEEEKKGAKGKAAKKEKGGKEEAAEEEEAEASKEISTEEARAEAPAEEGRVEKEGS